MCSGSPVYDSPLDAAAFFQESLRRFDQRLRCILDGKRDAAEGQEWGGLYVSESEVWQLLRADDADTAVPADDGLTELTDVEPDPRFDRMTEVCSLTVLDRWIFLAAVAPLLDAKYARIYGYLHDNMGRTSASLHLLYLLFARSQAERMTLLSRLAEDAPLIRFGLLRSSGSGYGMESLGVPSFILDFLMGLRPSNVLGFPVFSPDSGNGEVGHNSGAVTQEEGILCYCDGNPFDLWQLTLHTASESNECLVAVDAGELPPEPSEELSSRLESVFLCAALRDDVICLKDADRLLGSMSWYPLLRRLVSRTPDAARWILTGRTLMDFYRQMERCFPGRRLIESHVAMSDYEQRLAFWRERLPVELRENADTLASRYELDSGEIDHALIAARSHAQGGPITVEDLFCGIRRVRGMPRSRHIQPVRTDYEWEDLIVPEKCLRDLKQIEMRLLFLERIRSEWGFARRVPKRGTSVLFCGESGVGKTMTASILARTLHLDLYRVDISQVVSKYIGETEKNLSEVFDTAESAGVALFFDEADALFGKRTEVSDSHDRYANVETGFLLQKMEDFGGFSILATNLRQNMDSAFLRRIQAVVEFPFPSAGERLRMWRSMFPSETPLSDDIDFDWLAENIVLSGGNLHNVILDAAIQAMADASPVCMSHIRTSVFREFDKMQKRCVSLSWPEGVERKAPSEPARGSFAAVPLRAAEGAR